MIPKVYDLFCGLGGWSEGFLTAGYDVTGYDIEAHEYWLPAIEHDNQDGGKNTKPIEKRGWTQGCAVSLGLEGATAQPRTRLAKYPGTLILRDVLTIHGSEFADATAIVASPPCQNYSYLAMPWSRSADPNNSKAAKALRKKWETEGPDNRLFDACFRIQQEACEDAGRHIPLIVENVRGAQPWVGRAKANYGSFYLWGDVEQIGNRIQVGPDIGRFGAGLRMLRETKTVAHVNKRDGARSTVHLTSQFEHDRFRGEVIGTKIGGDWFSDPKSTCRKHGSRSQARKAASATIAKIPRPLSDYVALALMPAKKEVAA